MDKHIIHNGLRNVYLSKELWDIIFDWKWRLEHRSLSIKMIDIHTQMIDIMSMKRTCYKGNRLNNINFEFTGGNNWYKLLKYNNAYWGITEKQTLVKVNEKCGIELLNWRDVPIHRYNMPSFPVFCNKNTLHFHLTESLGIKCPINAKWQYMMKLLRTV